MVNININWIAMSDQNIVKTIGEFLKTQRLNQNKTQSQLAGEAGLNRWTLSQIENGEGITLNSLIQILRSLNLLSVLDNFTIEQQVSPLELARTEYKKRQRARNKLNNDKIESEW